MSASVRHGPLHPPPPQAVHVPPVHRPSGGRVRRTAGPALAGARRPNRQGRPPERKAGAGRKPITRPDVLPHRRRPAGPDMCPRRHPSTVVSLTRRPARVGRVFVDASANDSRTPAGADFTRVYRLVRPPRQHGANPSCGSPLAGAAGEHTTATPPRSPLRGDHFGRAACDPALGQVEGGGAGAVPGAAVAAVVVRPRPPGRAEEGDGRAAQPALAFGGLGAGGARWSCRRRDFFRGRRRPLGRRWLRCPTAGRGRRTPTTVVPSAVAASVSARVRRSASAARCSATSRCSASAVRSAVNTGRAGCDGTRCGSCREAFRSIAHDCLADAENPPTSASARAIIWMTRRVWQLILPPCVWHRSSGGGPRLRRLRGFEQGHQFHEWADGSGRHRAVGAAAGCSPDRLPTPVFPADACTSPPVSRPAGRRRRSPCRRRSAPRSPRRRGRTGRRRCGWP